MFDIYTFFGISFSMNDHQKMFEDILWFWRMKKEFLQYMKEKKIKTFFGMNFSMNNYQKNTLILKNKKKFL